MFIVPVYSGARSLVLLSSLNKNPLFVLSPNDLVYLPNIGNDNTTKEMDYSRIYKFVSCNKSQGFFIPANIASPILAAPKMYDQNELGSNKRN